VRRARRGTARRPFRGGQATHAEAAPKANRDRPSPPHPRRLSPPRRRAAAPGGTCWGPGHPAAGCRPGGVAGPQCAGAAMPTPSRRGGRNGEDAAVTTVRLALRKRPRRESPGRPRNGRRAVPRRARRTTRIRTADLAVIGVTPVGVPTCLWLGPYGCGSAPTFDRLPCPGWVLRHDVTTFGPLVNRSGPPAMVTTRANLTPVDTSARRRRLTWMWRLESVDGSALNRARLACAYNQSDAESWAGRAVAELADRRRPGDAASEDDTEVYGPMSLGEH